jgi:hypothetical protein
MTECPYSVLLNDGFISFRLIEACPDAICQAQGSKTDERIARDPQSKEAEMSILNAFDHYLVGFRARRDLARTERMINTLPPEVQKDIGWPQALEDAHRRLIHERGRNHSI